MNRDDGVSSPFKNSILVGVEVTRLKLSTKFRRNSESRHLDSYFFNRLLGIIELRPVADEARQCTGLKLKSHESLYRTREFTP